MPERSLPEYLRERLSVALTTGAPLRAPSAADARYKHRHNGPIWRPRGRMVAVGLAAAVALALVAVGGPQQPRQWVIESVHNVAHDVGVTLGQGTPSNSPASSEPHGSPRPAINSPGPRPAASGSQQAVESPDANESPEANPESGDDSVEASPTPEPDDSSGGGDGDRSNSGSSPSPDN